MTIYTSAMIFRALPLRVGNKSTLIIFKTSIAVWLVSSKWLWLCVLVTLVKSDYCKSGASISRGGGREVKYEGWHMKSINILIYWEFMTVIHSAVGVGHLFLRQWQCAADRLCWKANNSAELSCSFWCINVVTLTTVRMIKTEWWEGHLGLSCMSGAPLSYFIRSDTFRSFNYTGKRLGLFH